MRRLLLAAASSFASFAATAQPIQPSPIHGDTPGHTCNLTGTDRFVGRPGNKMMGEAIKAVSRAAVLRWAPPGTMLTMDYRADRVTIYLDARKKITKITCG
jgi:hypothetical protein